MIITMFGKSGSGLSISAKERNCLNLRYAKAIESDFGTSLSNVVPFTTCFG